MSLGPNTLVVDGQRNLFPSLAAFNPTSYGQQSTGVPNVSPTTPPFIGAGSSPASAGYVGVNGYGTADNNAQMTAIAAQNPHNLKVSPVWWAVGSLLIGLMLLKGVHWRQTTLEGFSESGHAGGARESAGESA